MDIFQQQIITGSLLGDGSLAGTAKHPNWNCKFIKSQSKFDFARVDKLSYMKYQLDILKNYVRRIVPYSRLVKLNGIEKKVEGYLIRSVVRKEFTQLANLWYSLNIKQIPKNISITPLSLCIWYMDDGTKDKGINRVRIATNCFQEAEVAFLIDKLGKIFNLYSSLIHNNKNQPMIEIGGYNNYKLLYDTIIPFVKWDCFKYKVEPPKAVVYLSGDNHPLTKLRNSDILEILNLYNSGISQTKIANIFNVKANTISTILNGKSRQKENVSAGLSGERNPRSKLSLFDVEVIRNCNDAVKILANKFSVSTSTIYRIKSGKGWRG